MNLLYVLLITYVATWSGNGQAISRENAGEISREESPRIRDDNARRKRYQVSERSPTDDPKDNPTIAYEQVGTPHFRSNRATKPELTNNTSVEEQSGRRHSVHPLLGHHLLEHLRHSCNHCHEIAHHIIHHADSLLRQHWHHHGDKRAKTARRLRQKKTKQKNETLKKAEMKVKEAGKGQARSHHGKTLNNVSQLRLAKTATWGEGSGGDDETGSTTLHASSEGSDDSDAGSTSSNATLTTRHHLKHHLDHVAERLIHHTDRLWHDHHHHHHGEGGGGGGGGGGYGKR